MEDDTPSLDQLRATLAEMDHTIAQAVRQRLEIAGDIGRLKGRRHDPLRDYAVERTVIARWRDALAPAGILPERAESFARWLIEESVRTQERTRGPRSASVRRSADIAVVGGSGAMGGWLATFFEDAGHRVAVVDPKPSESGRPKISSVEAAAERMDVVVFATPIRSTAPLLRRALASSTSALMFDVLSVKAPVINLLKSAAAAGRPVSSVHPMFGPSARTLSGRNLLVVSCGNQAADRAARAMFEASALSISEISIDHHDLLIAESLGLAHAVNLLFLSALARDPASPHELASAASTTFHLQAGLARAVAQEGAGLYLDIQALNPNSSGMYRDLRAALDRLADIVGQRDSEAFADLLRKGLGKLEPSAARMRKSTRRYQIRKPSPVPGHVR